MGDETEIRNEAAFYQAIDKATRIYKRQGNINGFVIRRNLANGAVCLGVGDDGENGMYETKPLTEKKMGGKVRNSM